MNNSASQEMLGAVDKLWLTPEQRELVSSWEAEIIASGVDKNKNHNDFVAAILKKSVKLLGNREWRLSNLYIIVDKNKEKIAYSPNRAQRRFLEKYDKYPMHIILKSRQLGFTTLMAILFLDSVLWGMNITAGIIAHIKEAATDIFDKKVKFALNNVPECVSHAIRKGKNSTSRLKILKDDKGENTFSVVVSTRSGTYGLTHISELAKIAKAYPLKAEEILTGSMSSIALGAKLVIESTAEGASGLYYETFNSSWKNRGRFETDKAVVAQKPYPHFFNWTYDDEQIDKFVEMYGIIEIDTMEFEDIDWVKFRDDNELTKEQLSWYYSKWIGLNKDTSKLFQEYPTTPEDAFLASGQCYFPQKKIVRLLDKMDTERIANTRYTITTDGPQVEPGGPLVILESPQPGRKYVVGADTGEGIEGGDSSTFAVIDEESKRPVAFYKGIISAYDFAETLVIIGKLYNKALLVPEANNHGYATLSRLSEEFQYPNIYMQRQYDDASQKYTTKLGWPTKSTTRMKALGNFRKVFIDHDDWLYKDLLEEMAVFVSNKSGRFEAISGKHDDLVMACACAFGAMDVRESEKKATEKESMDIHTQFALGKITIDEYIASGALGAAFALPCSTAPLY